MLTDAEMDRVANAVDSIRITESSYVDKDLVGCLMATVVDFQMQTTAVERALGHFETRRSKELQTLDQLRDVLSRYPDNPDGNTALAQWLFGYRLWTRVGLLRSLFRYVESIGVTDLDSMRRWAEGSSFQGDFEGRVRYSAKGRTYGLGPAVYNWLVMRLGVETVKPDVRLHRFVETAIERPATDDEVVAAIMDVARRAGTTPRRLDWSIWEAMGRQPLSNSRPADRP